LYICHCLGHCLRLICHVQMLLLHNASDLRNCMSWLRDWVWVGYPWSALVASFHSSSNSHRISCNRASFGRLACALVVAGICHVRCMVAPLCDCRWDASINFNSLSLIKMYYLPTLTLTAMREWTTFVIGLSVQATD